MAGSLRTSASRIDRFKTIQPNLSIRTSNQYWTYLDETHFAQIRPALSFILITIGSFFIQNFNSSIWESKLQINLSGHKIYSSRTSGRVSRHWLSNTRCSERSDRFCDRMTTLCMRLCVCVCWVGRMVRLCSNDTIQLTFAFQLPHRSAWTPYYSRPYYRCRLLRLRKNARGERKRRKTEKRRRRRKKSERVQIV